MYLSKPHGVFSVHISQEIRQETDRHAQGHCSEYRRVGFGTIHLLELRKWISSVFAEVNGKVVLLEDFTCLGLSPTLERIVWTCRIS